MGLGLLVQVDCGWSQGEWSRVVVQGWWLMVWVGSREWLESGDGGWWFGRGLWSGWGPGMVVGGLGGK